MKNYLCANDHHFRAKQPLCPYPACAAEVRPTTMSPNTDGGKPNFKHLPRLPGQPPESPSPALEPASATKHSIRWWAYIDRGRSRRTSSMKDNEFRWDATCSCGWDSGTGGAAMGEVDKMAQEHKRD